MEGKRRHSKKMNSTLSHEKEKERKAKIRKRMMTVILISIIIGVLALFYNMNKDKHIFKYISTDEYLKYAQEYGVQNPNQEDVYLMLLSKLDLDGFEEAVLGSDFFYDTNIIESNDIIIKNLLNNCSSITEIALFKDPEDSEIIANVSIDYLDSKGRKVVITYTNDGQEIIAFKKWRAITVVSNNLEKNIYRQW